MSGFNGFNNDVGRPKLSECKIRTLYVYEIIIFGKFFCSCSIVEVHNAAYVL